MGWGVAPRRWEGRTAYGGSISFTGRQTRGRRRTLRIIPAKCPLDHDVDTDHSWSPEDARNLLDRPSVLINLCATRRYYNPKYYEGLQVRYHPIAPQQEVSLETHVKFEDELIKLWTRGPRCANVIVHGTQGVRRTGLMVAGFLIRVLGFDPEEAIDIFQRVRGAPISSAEFRTALKDMEEDKEIDLPFKSIDYDYSEAEDYSDEDDSDGAEYDSDGTEYDCDGTEYDCDGSEDDPERTFDRILYDYHYWL